MASLGLSFSTLPTGRPRNLHAAVNLTTEWLCNHAWFISCLPNKTWNYVEPPLQNPSESCRILQNSTKKSGWGFFLPSCSGCRPPISQLLQQFRALIFGLPAGADDMAVALHVGLHLFGPGVVQQIQGLLPGTSSSTSANAGEIT